MQENNELIPKLNEFIAFALKMESEFVLSLQAFYKMARHSSAERLLLSLAGQSREHQQRLQELRQEGNLDTLAWREKGRAEGSVMSTGAEGTDKQNPPAKDLLDFLTLCIKRKEATCKVYRYLAGNIVNQDVAFLFKRLADEEKKQKDMLLDRYELEIICREQKYGS